MVGIGFWRPGPGTWASAFTLGVWWVLARFLLPPLYHWIVAAALVWLIILLGIPAAGVVARECDRDDPSFVVIDEAAGQMIALIAVPLRWQYLILSLILFRAFDILKPPPLRRLEKLHGGAGIVLDDVGAGVYALILIQAFIYLRALG